MLKKLRTALMMGMVFSSMNAAAVFANNDEDHSKQMTSKVLWGRDPFTKVADDSFRPSFDGSPAKGLTLTGVLIRGNDKTAIVNRALVQEGEEIQGYTILRIESDRVLLQDKTNEVTLRLGEV